MSSLSYFRVSPRSLALSCSRSWYSPSFPFQRGNSTAQHALPVHNLPDSLVHHCSVQSPIRVRAILRTRGDGNPDSLLLDTNNDGVADTVVPLASYRPRSA